MNKISIIIPAYNIEKYIKRTIDSVCAQTYKNIEVIVVDDGSSDNTFTIINECANNDSRIVPVHQENGGVTSARLHGVKMATGEWVGFVDGDDLIDEDMFEFLLSNALEYSAQISHCGYKMVFGDGMIRYLYNTDRLAEQDNITGLKDLLQGSFIEPGLCNKLYHHTLFDNLIHDSIMDASIGNYEDLLMNYYLFKESSKSIYEDKCKYSYMIRSNSANTSFSVKKYYDVKRVFEILMDDTHNNEELYDIAFGRYISYLIGYTTSSNIQCKRDSLNILKNKAKQLLSSTAVSKKVKTIYFLTTHFNRIYHLIRKYYDFINKKNEVYFK